ncbi:unnamed protein product [Rotaria magnacalcarata]
MDYIILLLIKFVVSFTSRKSRTSNRNITSNELSKEVVYNDFHGIYATFTLFRQMVYVTGMFNCLGKKPILIT